MYLAVLTPYLFFQEEQRKLAKQYREELRDLMEEHEEVHSEIRWRRVCVIFDDVSSFPPQPFSLTAAPEVCSKWRYFTSPLE